MRKKFIYKICGILAFAGLSAACIGVGISAIPSENTIVASADVTVAWGDTVKTSYLLGEEFAPPRNVAVQYNAATAEASFKALILPDGSVMNATEYTFSQTGEYTLVYAYRFPGFSTTYETTKTFEVLDSCYSVDMQGTSVSFEEIGTHKGAEGYDITLQAGDVFTYSKPINVYQNDRTNIITYGTSQVESKIAQGQFSKPLFLDAERIVVTLTDCYDPSISIELNMVFTKESGAGIYCRAKATGQTDIGLSKNNANHGVPQVIIDGDMYGVHSSTTFGGSMTMVSGYTRPSYLGWSFEKETNRIYFTVGSDGNNTYADKDGNPVTQAACHYELLINDLDNTDICATSFVGFTTGEVYVSVSGGDWSGASMNLEIEQIGEDCGEDLITYVDNTKPVVKIDTNNVQGPFYVQKGQEFTLFDATAYDVNFHGKPTARAYYNYDNDMKSAVAVNDGKFVPTSVGEYTLEYSARDSFGNVGVATVSVYAIEDPVTSLDTGLEKAPLTGLTAGVMVQLPAYSLTSYDGAENVRLSITFEAGGKEYPINANTCQFVPVHVGTNRIVYTYTDKLYTYTKSYEVDVANNPHPGFIEVAEVKDVYIRNAVYMVDDISGYMFHEDQDPTPVETTAYVRFDGGEYQKIADLTDLKITGSNTVQFKYVAGETEYETGELPVRDVGYGESLRMQDYFDGQFTAEPKSRYIFFTSDETSGTNILQFIMPLTQINFELDYRLPKEYANVESYDIILSDMASSKSLTLKFRQDETGVLRVYIGDSSVSLGGTLNDGAEKSVSYLAEEKCLQFKNPSSIVQYPYEFDFDGDNCKLSIRLNGISGDAGIEISKIQNQMITNETYDRFAPQMYVESPKGYMEQGSTATIFKAVASDVLSHVLEKNITVSVLSPTDEYAVSVDGILLQDVSPDRAYQFVLEEYGSYQVQYTARDESGKVSRRMYAIYSADMQAPTIRFNDGSTEATVQTMKVNHIYSLKSYTAEDNYTAAEDLEIHTLVYDVRTAMVFFDRDEVCFTEVGRYTVCVYCMDEEGNYTYITYQINVVPMDAATA